MSGYFGKMELKGSSYALLLVEVDFGLFKCVLQSFIENERVRAGES